MLAGIYRLDEPIDLSQQETWPKEISTKLNANLDLLRAYEEDRRRGEKISRENILARINPPKLCHSQERSHLLEWIDSCLNDRCLLGFHCTRLHELEIETVKRQGLRPLSKELAYERIQRLQEIGALPSQVASRLLSKNAVNNKHGERLGKLWFIFSRSCLRDEGGVSRLLSYWGGEALYWAHENDLNIAPVLKSIGYSCIIQAAVPIAMLNTFSSVGEKLISVFLSTRGVVTTDDGLLEGFLDQALAGEYIQRVIEYGEPEFGMLTDCKQWRCCLASSG